jgi:probable DNA metabolism protein
VPANSILFRNGPESMQVAHNQPMQAKLQGPIDLAGFRDEAMHLLAHQVSPDDVVWSLHPQPGDQYLQPSLASASRPRNVARAATAIVPASFQRLSEFVVLHRDPQRFALLYRLLWRLVHEPGLRNDPVDPDMLHAQHLAHAVRRDVHKMKANLRFLTLAPDERGESLQVAWYEPSHHVVEAAAPWFAKRSTAAAWAIFTPERSVRFEAGRLHYAPGIAAERAPGAMAPDALWRECFDSVFRSPPASATGA